MTLFSFFLDLVVSFSGDDNLAGSDDGGEEWRFPFFLDLVVSFTGDTDNLSGDDSPSPPLEPELGELCTAPEPSWSLPRSASPFLAADQSIPFPEGEIDGTTKAKAKGTDFTPEKGQGRGRTASNYNTAASDHRMQPRAEHSLSIGVLHSAVNDA